jgi:adenylate cyclase
VAALAACLLIAGLLPEIPELLPDPASKLVHKTAELVHETAFDIVLAAQQRIAATRDPSLPVIVIDIDRRSLEAVGPWPWRRETIAGLVETVAAGRPAAIAIDVLFEKPDERSPAALARRLGEITGRSEITALAGELPDGDKRLAVAVASAPTTLGVVLDPDLETAFVVSPVLSRGPLPFDDDLWQSAGGIGPTAALVTAASGFGVLSLPGDDGMIRYVPLFVLARRQLLPGLAIDAIRLARGASSFLITAEPPAVVIAGKRVPLARDGLLRLLPVPPEHQRARTLAAADIIEGKADTSRLKNALVLIGGSAPQLGGLRKTPSDPLTPSVQIQADAIEQMLAGRAPHRIHAARFVEPLLIFLAGAIAVTAGTLLSPLAGLAMLTGAGAMLWTGSLILSLLADQLADPLPPSTAAALVFAVTSGIRYSLTRQRARMLRLRLEQHLAPSVVRRMVEQPGLVKLRGEKREVTALFTDIENFTVTTHRAGPEELVGVLDQYFEGMAEIVIEHGGMIDKIVGDAVHALFNAPVGLNDHPRHAVECAMAITVWTEAYRRSGVAAAISLGRTRVGIETGLAIVGDVGIRSKLDYTAHGDAVNMAARLEAANKQFGSSVCVGPVAASRCPARLLRPLGSITVRGRDEPAAVFEPWPHDTPPQWRDAYLAAFRMIDRDVTEAASMFEKLSGDRPADPVPLLIAGRIRPSSR